MGSVPGLRVLLLAAALALPVLVQAEEAKAPAREYIYGAELMTAQEREAYRRAMERAEGEQAREGVREQHRERLRARARKRGVELVEPHGLVRPPK